MEEMVKVLTEQYPKDSLKGTHSDGYYLDGYLKANLDHMIKDVTKKNYDGFVLIVGREGFGKSTLAFQIAKYCDNDFDLSRVVFTADQFLEAVKVAPRYSAIVFDETMGYLSSRGAMSKFNKVLIKVMSEMRSKNLFVFLNIPNFFMMDWYVAQHRTTGLIYIRQRGIFGSYDYPTKKRLYMEGKKTHSYSIPPNYRGNFRSTFVLPSQEEYEAKKQKAIDGWAENQVKENLWMKQRDILIQKCVKDNLMDTKSIAEDIGLSRRQIQRVVSEEAT